MESRLIVPCNRYHPKIISIERLLSLFSAFVRLRSQSKLSIVDYALQVISSQTRNIEFDVISLS